MREVAGELQMNPTVVQRKAEPPLEAGDLREQVAQAGDEAGQEQQEPSVRILMIRAKHTQLSKSGLSSRAS